MLFETRKLPFFEVAPDGRFLMLEPRGTACGTAPIHVVLNWPALLMPAR